MSNFKKGTAQESKQEYVQLKKFERVSSFIKDQADIICKELDSYKNRKPYMFNNYRKPIEFGFDFNPKGDSIGIDYILRCGSPIESIIPSIENMCAAYNYPKELLSGEWKVYSRHLNLTDMDSNKLNHGNQLNNYIVQLRAEIEKVKCTHSCNGVNFLYGGDIKNVGSQYVDFPRLKKQVLAKMNSRLK